MKSPADTETPLATLDRDLARFFNVPPLGCTPGADQSLSDDLILCGILGGKDVGKSTLINALAGAAVSRDEFEVGRGTDRPRAYVHRTREEALRVRLASDDSRDDVEVVLHDVDRIANIVLVDLPDFDSEFLDHLNIVRRIVPRLDRVLWMQTPRKLGDRAWVRMIRDVIKDDVNVHWVLSKLDELLADEHPWSAGPPQDSLSNRRLSEQFWIAQRQWITRSLEAAGCAVPDEYLFLVSGLYPDADSFVRRIAHRWADPQWLRYLQDRAVVREIAEKAAQDLERLRSAVLGPVSPEHAIRIKRANLKAEQRTWAARLDEHYALSRTLALLGDAADPDYHHSVGDAAFGPEFCDAAARRLAAEVRGDAELADDLLASRIDRWPLLRLAYFPLGWLSRLIGRRWSLIRAFASSPGTEPWGVDTNIAHRTLSDRVAMYRETWCADHGTVCASLNLGEQIPSAERLARRLAQALRGLPEQREREILAEARGKDRQASLLGRALLWLVFLWFPFLQPITAGVLDMLAAGESWEIARGLARIVAALSAAHLLAGFFVVAIIFALLMAGMYARCLKDVRRCRAEALSPNTLALRIDELLMEEVTVPLIQPLADKAAKVREFHDRLQRIVEARRAA